jgi:hypothetical protein
MKNNKPKVIYDKDSKVLSWELSNKRSVDSDIQGNVVIDYDRQGSIVRINFYDFNINNFKSIKNPLAFLSRQVVKV